MAVIFIFSAMPAAQSTDTSTTVTGLIIGLCAKAGGISAAKQAALIAFWEPVVRKLAHMTEYAILAFLLMKPCGTERKKYIGTYFVILLICACYACSDEFHQLFVQGRAGRLTDVLIDSSGAALVLVIYRLSVGFKI